MRKQVIRSPQAPEPAGPYSQAIATEAQRLVFLSAQAGVGPGGALAGRDDVAAQARQAMQNLRAVLSSAGLDWDHVIKATVYLLDLADQDAVDAEYARCFAERLPARTCVQVSALRGGARVAIELVAAS